MKLGDGADIGVPPARFVQWKAVLHSGPIPPRVSIACLFTICRRTLRPISMKSPPRPACVSSRSPNPSRPHPIRAAIQIPGSRVSTTLSPAREIATRLASSGPLTTTTTTSCIYALYYRGENDSRWLLLKDDVSDRSYSFDASLLPDGAYLVKLVASDAPSHSPGEALSTEKESARFEVDTTPPQIQNLAATDHGDRIHVQFRAVDSFSPIKRAEYSIDAGDWQFVEPTGQLSDSKTEDYDFVVPLPGSPDAGPGKSSSS